MSGTPRRDRGKERNERYALVGVSGDKPFATPGQHRPRG
jgi:hypothetical protein